MKTNIKILSILLIVIYSTLTFRSVFPLIDYGINYHYIVTELCEQKDALENMCMGVCHLKKQFAKQFEDSAPKAEFVSIDFLKIPHKITKIDYVYLEPINKIFQIEKCLCSFSNFNEPLLPPPKV